MKTEKARKIDNAKLKRHAAENSAVVSAGRLFFSYGVDHQNRYQRR
jgi:hypothetical protein